ncbi:MAG: response regulator [Desulfomonile tiedjei]|nr:response regulator [Desulfomonile tiedjei]
MMPHRIMIVEDERIVALNMEVGLSDLGYEVVSVESSGENAIASARETSPDLILMDIMLDGELDGIDAAKAIKSHSDIPIVYLTAYSDERLLSRAMESVPAGYLVKPVSARSVHASIQTALSFTEVMNCLKQSKPPNSGVVELETRSVGPFRPAIVYDLKNALERALMECSLNIDFDGRTLREVTEQVTRSMCLGALQRCKGNKREAAKLLGISRDSLYRYLKEFGILPDSQA